MSWTQYFFGLNPISSHVYWLKIWWSKACSGFWHWLFLIKCSKVLKVLAASVSVGGGRCVPLTCFSFIMSALYAAWTVFWCCDVKNKDSVCSMKILGSSCCLPFVWPGPLLYWKAHLVLSVVKRVDSFDTKSKSSYKKFWPLFGHLGVKICNNIFLIRSVIHLVIHSIIPSAKFFTTLAVAVLVLFVWYLVNLCIYVIPKDNRGGVLNFFFRFFSGLS